jgi:hypothetical protein
MEGIIVTRLKLHDLFMMLLTVLATSSTLRALYTLAETMIVPPHAVFLCCNIYLHMILWMNNLLQYTWCSSSFCSLHTLPVDERYELVSLQFTLLSDVGIMNFDTFFPPPDMSILETVPTMLKFEINVNVIRVIHINQTNVDCSILICCLYILGFLITVSFTHALHY